MKPNIQNIIFDVGRVLVEWRPDKIVQSFTPDSGLQASLLENVFSHPDWLRWDLGEFNEAQLIHRFSARVGISPEQGQELINKARASHELKTGTVQLMDELKAQGYRLLCLSNMPAEFYEHLSQRFNFWEQFEGILISAHVGQLKPDPDIFHTLLEKFQIDPTASLFIDDSEANIETAASLGIHGIVFTDAEDCRRQLEEYLH